MIGELGGELAIDARPVDAGLLEQRAAFEHARHATPAPRTLPRIRGELRRAVEIGERAADVGLKLREELGRAIEKLGHVHMLPSTRAVELALMSPAIRLVRALRVFAVIFLS